MRKKKKKSVNTSKLGSNAFLITNKLERLFFFNKKKKKINNFLSTSTFKITK